MHRTGSDALLDPVNKQTRSSLDPGYDEPPVSEP
jgi:hypothetical protein